MSVWMHLLVAPQKPLFLNQERFCALTEDLIARKLVAMPCALLGGSLSVMHPLGDANIAASAIAEEEVTLSYKGTDSLSLLKTLRELPIGQRNFCVWFAGFNWENPEISASFSRQGYANADLLLYSLARPQVLQCYDCFSGRIGAEHRIQTCFRTTGNHGPWDIKETPLEPLLVRHFGSELIVDCSYS